MQQNHSEPPSRPRPADQRSSERFGIALSVTMEDHEGESLDISETGILFETDCEPQLGATIAMTLQYSVDGEDFELGCAAKVVRVERVGNKVNVAARLLAPLLSAQ